ncbi:hypothetical protein J6590_053966 [Homalodisca vitripennis]|nr:hypothetical protein J6590_053966 [Homalodisca vitripennis]
MLLMQTNVPPFLGLPPPEGGPRLGTFEPGGRFKSDELTIERVKSDKGEKEQHRDMLSGFEKFGWGNNFNYKDLNQLLGRPQDVARRPVDHGPPGVRPLEEMDLRHLELEMELLRSRQAKRAETERRREHARRNSTENAIKTEMNGKLPEYMLPMSPPGKQLGRNLGPLNVSRTTLLEVT